MRCFLFALFLAVPTTAMAQPSKAADVTTMTGDDCAKARKAGKTCVLTIEDEDLTGRVPTAGDPPLGGRTFGDFASLIRVRTHFITEILKSAEDID